MSGSVGDNPYRASGVIAAAAGGGIEWCSTVKTGAFCAAAGKGYFINTCGGTFEVTLPASADAGDQINFTDYARTWGTACKEFTLDQNSLKFQGQTSPKPEYDTSGATVKIIYADATQGWIPQLDKEVSNEVPQPYNVQYLVVAGGASGGTGDIGGAGGAGGYRFVPGKSFSVTGGTPVTVTVGAGGAQRCRSTTYQGNPGSNSVFSTITSAGGGGGGAGNVTDADGLDGGSGGGAGYRCGSGGSGDTPPAPVSQGNDGGGPAPSHEWYMGGGGGHGAAGADGTPSGGGCGGIGTPSALDFGPLAPSYGTPGPAPGRYFAGGGGGGKDATGCAAAGGAGGGGKGSSGDTPGVAGGVNTGGGGGGGENANPTGHGYAGGKGIVAIRYVTACATECVAGGDASATCSSDTIRVFTGDGTFVP